MKYKKKPYKKRKSGSKTLRKLIRIKITDKKARKLKRALKRIGIPSCIKKLKKGKYLDLRSQVSTKEIIRKNKALRKMLKK